MAFNAAIEAGQQAVAALCQALADIRVRNTELEQLLEAMAQASAEQSGAMDQMTGALWDMTRLTQENAVLVDRLAEAAAALFREAVDHVQQASGMGRASGP